MTDSFSHPPDFLREPVLHVVATSHLDTQWRWTFQDTIARYLPATLRENFARFEKSPNYIFSFEGAFRYMLAKEYYPEDYETLRHYIAQGRWRVCGSSIDAGDVNTVSAESLVRQTLYGNGFFRDEFGVESCDIFLPDCFGFGWALPTMAAHCGLHGFSTSKLEWGSSVGIPFNLGFWEGVDGNGLIAAINPTQYSLPITTDLSTDEIWRKRIQKNGETCGAFVDFKYFGLGDTGGAPDEASIQSLEDAIAACGPTRVVSAGADQLFRELASEQIARLPRHRGEFLLIEHGVGTFTSNGAMKRWNRKNEVLAAMAEAAATMAYSVCGEPYPRERLRNAWIRFLANQMHDILPGTCIPEAYAFSWNDEIVSLNEFSGVLSHALSVLASGLDTNTAGFPILLFNHAIPASQGPAEFIVNRGDFPAGEYSLRDPNGRTIPVQEVSSNGDEWRFVFLPPAFAGIGCQVMELVAAPEVCERVEVHIESNAHIVESPTLRIRLNADGDIESIFHKQQQREHLSAPIRLQFLPQAPKEWPAWTFEYKDISADPIDFVSGPASIQIVERGPVRATVEVLRSARGSIFRQRVSVYTNGIVEIDHAILWESPACLLKLAFPLAAKNPTARYDIGAGVIERGNNHPRLHEVPALEWAELQDSSGDFGLRIWPEAKFGWDKPDDHTLRLTLLHTPEMTGFECHLGGANFVDRFLEQGQLDFGHHNFRVRLVPHHGGEPTINASFQPALAIPVSRHVGQLGRAINALSTDALGVEVSALKLSEKRDEIVLRLLEKTGTAHRVQFDGILAPARAEIVNGMEDPQGPAPDSISLAPYGPLAISYPAQAAGHRPIKTIPLDLPFNLDAISTNANRQDGDIDGRGHSLAAELIPSIVEDAGIPFHIGPTEYRALNCVVPLGQKIALPAGCNRLHLLLASVGGDLECEWHVGGGVTNLRVADYAEPLGRWDTRIVDGRYVNRVEEMIPARIKNHRVAWTGTHRHSRASNADEPYVYTYLFHHVLELPEGLGEFTLPYEPRLRVFAATVSSGGPADFLWLGVDRFA